QYSDFQPYIQQEMEGTPNLLYPEPVNSVMSTSGTTGEPKLVPYTESTWKVANRFRHRYFGSGGHIRPYLHGKLLTIVAPAIYRQIGNWDVGYVSGYGLKKSGKLMASKLVPKPEVFDIVDWQEKFQETIRQAVACDRVTASLGATSFMMALLRRIKYESYDWLMHDPKIPEKVRNRIKDAHIGDGIIDIQSLWPDYSLFFHAAVVRDLYEPVVQDLAGDVHIHESYASTEGVFACQLYEDKHGVVPMVDDVFFEFAEMQEGPLRPDADTIPLSDVKLNTPYRVVISGRTCLWRYDHQDVVVFIDSNPPTMRCLGKSKNVISISGEKVTESDLGLALRMACETQDALYREFVVAPLITETESSYHIFVEFTKSPNDFTLLGTDIDEALKQLSDAYNLVRNAGAISNVVVHPVPAGRFSAYENQRLQSGQAIVGQTKPPRLISFDNATQQLLQIPLLTTT
ncbi:MAG: GH3 auxin-responsive promoter family protein, partial [Candidatus Hermodarchaeota archaeon]|nr:GH3 auxin-responsive promoter family protein [Candidatus Hermodarchaeota archaeon]